MTYLHIDRLLVASLLSISLVGGFSSVVSGANNNNNKITICHATSSATNPWNRIVVSVNANNGHFDNNGTAKAGHETDLVFQGEVNCPQVTATPTMTQAPTAVPTYIPTPTATVFPTSIPTTMPTNAPTATTAPTVTPTVTITGTVTPTTGTTPTATPTASATTTPTPTQTNSTNSTSTNNEKVEGIVLKDVLGASTMAKTGNFVDSLMNVLFATGMMIVTAASLSYVKEKKA